MKMTRYSAVFILIMLMLGLQGCGKVWSVDFTTAVNLNSWRQQDWTDPYTMTLDSDGLFIDGKLMIAPYGFDGDFSVSIVFSLSATEDTPLNLLNFAFGDGSDVPLVDAIQAVFSSIGTASEAYYIEEASPTVTMAQGSSISGIDRNGLNTFKFAKNGKRIKVYMNGTILCNKDFVNFPNGLFYLYLNVNAMEADQLIFKNVEVKYCGNIVTRP